MACLSGGPAQKYLTTLGEATKRWLSALSLLYAEMQCWSTPSAFRIRVPHVAMQEWRCNGGKCTSNGSTISLARLFTHQAPDQFDGTVRFEAENDVYDASQGCTRGGNTSGCKLGHAYRLALATVAYDVMRGSSDCSQCGYLFLRRPLKNQNGSIIAAMANLSARSTQIYASVQLDLVARASHTMASKHNVRCMEVNYDAGRSRGVTPADVLRTLNGRLNGPNATRFYHRKRKEGAISNAHAMECAMRARLLVTELGTQWTDFPLEKRCTLGLKSIILGRAPTGEVFHVPATCNAGGGAQYGRTVPFVRGRDPGMNLTRAFREGGVGRHL